jgi:hypothetical protein
VVAGALVVAYALLTYQACLAGDGPMTSFATCSIRIATGEAGLGLFGTVAGLYLVVRGFARMIRKTPRDP